jgi:Spy/CpxP family protein refolding chaperone
VPKLNPAIVALAAVALTALNIYAANATATDAFHLWLKCKAVHQHYWGQLHPSAV